jgi:hypothetical protein
MSENNKSKIANAALGVGIVGFLIALAAIITILYNQYGPVPITYALKSDIGAVSLDNNKITDLATPTANGHAANKSYVDGLVGSHTTYTTSTFPTASTNVGRIVYNSDTSSMFFSNGIKWLELISWTQPIMTSTISPVPYVITTNSNAYAPTLSFYKCFDGDLITDGNWWHTVAGDYAAGTFNYTGTGGKTGIANLGNWIVMQMDVARSISKYSYTSRFFGGGAAKSWHIIYSNDGTNYASADNKVDQTINQNTTVSYTFTPIIAKYWGIQIYRSSDTICITQELTFS